jgi:WhiB family redox-sensing transcriptional regulator
MPHTRVSTGPGLLEPHWHWRFQARCRTVDPDVFFALDNEHYGPRQRREQAAKRICGTCPAVAHCRTHAEQAHERYGVWGGTSEHDRRKAHRTTD